VSDAFTSRSLGALDLDIAARVHGEAFAVLGERAWTRQEIGELLASPGVAGHLLQQQGREIGFALCRIVLDEAELLTIAVLPTERRRGAGRLLLQMVLDLAREREARQLFLEVGEDNPAALALYRQTGFEEIGRRAGYYQRQSRAPADALVMRFAFGA
jgi:ribosomal-protein-alanine N-acetyltransferase